MTRCCERQARLWLVVAIADVSHYVKVGSALDGGDAYDRGIRVHFPAAGHPPCCLRSLERLRFLNPRVERRLHGVRHGDLPDRGDQAVQVLSCCDVLKARLTYNQCGQRPLYDNDPAALEVIGAVAPPAEPRQVVPVLLKARAGRGAIDLRRPRKPADLSTTTARSPRSPEVAQRRPSPDHRGVHAGGQRLCPSSCRPRGTRLHRVHEGPTPEKLAKLRDFWGIWPPTGAVRSRRRAIVFRPLASIAIVQDPQLLQTVDAAPPASGGLQPRQCGHSRAGLTPTPISPRPSAAIPTSCTPSRRLSWANAMCRRI